MYNKDRVKKATIEYQELAKTVGAFNAGNTIADKYQLDNTEFWAMLMGYETAE